MWARISDTLLSITGRTLGTLEGKLMGWKKLGSASAIGAAVILDASQFWRKLGEGCGCTYPAVMKKRPM